MFCIFSAHHRISLFQLKESKWSTSSFNISIAFLQSYSTMILLYPFVQQNCIAIRIAWNSLSKGEHTLLSCTCTAPLYTPLPSRTTHPAEAGSLILINDASTLHFNHCSGGAFHLCVHLTLENVLCLSNALFSCISIFLYSLASLLVVDKTFFQWKCLCLNNNMFMLFQILQRIQMGRSW